MSVTTATLSSSVALLLSGTSSENNAAEHSLPKQAGLPPDSTKSITILLSKRFQLKQFIKVLN